MNSSNGPLNSYPNYLEGVALSFAVVVIFVALVICFIIVEICFAASRHNKKHAFLKRFIIYLAVLIAFLYGAQAIDCLTNKTNKDGWINPFTRTAREGNVVVKQSYEFNLSDNYKVIPYYDIKNLEITVYFLDNNNTVISTKTKSIGNVKADSVYNFAFSLSEFSASELLTIKKWKSEVSGGTVSYFATISAVMPH